MLLDQFQMQETLLPFTQSLPLDCTLGQGASQTEDIHILPVLYGLALGLKFVCTLDTWMCYYDNIAPHNSLHWLSTEMKCDWLVHI